ncbi:uncharacterized protein [Diadema setosum]|uniref:uncharacterized protein n=1 Tax=Diadema setosum TaxID=31175 RepID=UPI003B3A8417
MSEATNRPTTTQSTIVMTSADMQRTMLDVAMDTTSSSPQLTTSISSTASFPTSPEGSTTPTTLGSTLPAHFTAPAGALAIVADEYTGKFWKITSTEEEWLSFETVLIDMTVDERDGNVFWTEQGGTRIWRCDIGSNTKETLFEGSNTPPREVAFDGQDRALYFSHILENNGFGFAISFIHVDNSESGRNDFVLLTSLVRALVIDEQRFAYWTDNDGLKCKHLSGTGSTETIDATLGNLPTTLSIDPTIANRVYLTTVNKVYLWEFSTGAWRKTDLSAYIGTHPANTQGTTQVNFLFFFNSVLYVQAGNGIGVIHNLDRNPIDHSEITVEYLALIGPQSPVALYVKSLFP